MLDKNILLGFAAGCVIGVVGYKFYNEHKDDIEAKIKSLKDLKGFGGAEENAEQSEHENASSSLEELEAQKERLEDLIAEIKAKQSEA